MKNIKLISLVLSMLISFVLKAQEKTSANKKVNGSAEIEMLLKNTFHRLQKNDTF